MKQLMTALAVIVTIIASCGKLEPETNPGNAKDNGNIIINLSVGNFSSNDTKALIKTDWVSGDQLLIWFDENAGEKPDMVIKYDGSRWDQDVTAQVSGNAPAASGNMKVLYNNTLIVTAKDPYTFNSRTSTLSGKIQTWTFLTEIQVVVTGIEPGDVSKYSLACDKFTPCTGYEVGTDCITAKAGDANTPVPGIINEDGEAFVFASCTSYGIKTTFNFSLSDKDFSAPAGSTPTNPEFVDLGLPSGLKWATHNVGASKPEEFGYYFFWGGIQGYIMGPVKGYSPAKTLIKDVSKINALKIAINKFEERTSWVKPENGVELVDGFCWKNTPFNNGSSNYDATYFAGVRSTVCPSDVLAPENDAALAYCGVGCRMPTTAEFKELSENTTNTWVTNYNGTGINGRLFTGKKEGYKDKSIFFPAAGYGDGKRLDYVSHLGDCWSSSLYTYQINMVNWAYDMYYDNTHVKPQNFYVRCWGINIRPVSD